MLDDLLQKLFGMTAPPDFSTWTRVAKLSPEDMGRKKKQDAEEDDIKHEMEILACKAKVLQARQQLMACEWWAYLRKTYGIPSRSLHVTDDGVIVMKPDYPEPPPISPFGFGEQGGT